MCYFSIPCRRVLFSDAIVLENNTTFPDTTVSSGIIFRCDSVGK